MYLTFIQNRRWSVLMTWLTPVDWYAASNLNIGYCVVLEVNNLKTKTFYSICE